MGVTVEWYDAEKTIIHYKFAGQWSWDQFWTCWNQSMPEVTALDHPFSGIMDLSASTHIPAESLMHLRAVTRTHIPNYSGASAYVGIGKMGEMYERLMRTINPGLFERIQFFFVPTVEEGVRTLREWRETKQQNL